MVKLTKKKEEEWEKLGIRAPRDMQDFESLAQPTDLEWSGDTLSRSIHQSVQRENALLMV